MNELLESLYDHYYTPPDLSEFTDEVEQARQELLDRLDKPERKLLLQLIDAKNNYAGDLSLDSFLYGFKLAWQLAEDLKHFCADAFQKDEVSAPDSLVSKFQLQSGRIIPAVLRFLL